MKSKGKSESELKKKMMEKRNEKIKQEQRTYWKESEK